MILDCNKILGLVSQLMLLIQEVVNLLPSLFIGLAVETALIILSDNVIKAVSIVSISGNDIEFIIVGNGSFYV